MRGKRNKVTDIVVIVINADDRVMPQTKEGYQSQLLQMFQSFSQSIR